VELQLYPDLAQRSDQPAPRGPDDEWFAVNENTPTDRLIAWTLERFAGQRMIMTTSFGMEGCALIDMYARHGKPVTCVYLDTMFFFPETHRLREQMAERYPTIHFVNRGTTLTPQEQEKQYGPELWKHKPDLCCKIRKVDPMYPVMAETDVWITGLRRSQSANRANLRVIDWDWKYQVLKVSPLANWERTEIWEYIQKHNVPYNELHEKGYPTVGCTHCTVPVPGTKPGDYSRAGRWSTSEKTECGLHGGAGI
jgi:phosphoadenosine phosphosulfate reductase